MNATSNVSDSVRNSHPVYAGKRRRKMAATTTLEYHMVKSGRQGRPDLPMSGEQDLIVEARNGSPAAIELLISRYESRIFRMARNITGNHEDAEEVIQNAFLKAFQNLATFRGDSSFYTWLARIAINQSLMKVRGRRFKEVSIDKADNAEHNIISRELEDWGPNPEERYSQEELLRILDISISELSPEYRIVFQLRDVEGLRINETAQALALSVPTVKTRLARARFQLRNLLDIYLRPMHSVENRSRLVQRAQRPRCESARSKFGLRASGSRYRNCHFFVSPI